MSEANSGEHVKSRFSPVGAGLENGWCRHCGRHRQKHVEPNESCPVSDGEQLPNSGQSVKPIAERTLTDQLRLMAEPGLTIRTNHVLLLNRAADEREEFMRRRDLARRALHEWEQSLGDAKCLDSLIAAVRALVEVPK